MRTGTLVLGMAGVGLMVWAAACSDSESSSTATGTTTGTATGTGGAGGATGTAGSTSEGGHGDGGTGGAPAPEVKIAFLGDSGMWDEFRANLQLIAQEGADFVVHEGDFDYDDDPDGFWAVIDELLGSSYPYFLSVGNHDAEDPPGPADPTEWAGYAAHMSDHMDAAGVVLDDPDLSDQMWSTTFLGVRLVSVGLMGVDHPEFAEFIGAQLDSTDPSWKVCNWHENQTAMQLGDKGNEMGWPVYETCRDKGAFIVTGHEHTYERTKTLVDMEAQLVDDTCPDPNQLCVGPGRTFAVVQGLGGVEVRNQDRCLPTTPPYGCNGEWAFVYTSDQDATFGTLFVVLNAGGDPRLAHAYFRNIDGETVDEFDIHKDEPR